jgi:hypothetical protein
VKTIALCASLTPDPDCPGLNLICHRESGHPGHEHWEHEHGQHWYGSPGEPSSLYGLVPEEGDGLALTPEAMERLAALPDAAVTLTGVFEKGGE